MVRLHFQPVAQLNERGDANIKRATWIKSSFFGKTVTAVLTNCPGPLALLAGGRRLNDTQQEARRSEGTASVASDDDEVSEGGDKALRDHEAIHLRYISSDVDEFE